MDELWAVRITTDAAEVWTENGRQVAQFVDAAVASEVVDNHNMEVELSEPDAPAVIRSQKELLAERIAMYRKSEPDGARLLSRIQEQAARALKLLALKAPEVIIADSAETLENSVAIFRALHRGSLGQAVDEG